MKSIKTTKERLYGVAKRHFDLPEIEAVQYEEYMSLGIYTLTWNSGVIGIDTKLKPLALIAGFGDYARVAHRLTRADARRLQGKRPHLISKRLKLWLGDIIGCVALFGSVVAIGLLACLVA